MSQTNKILVMLWVQVRAQRNKEGIQAGLIPPSPKSTKQLKYGTTAVIFYVVKMKIKKRG